VFFVISDITFYDAVEEVYERRGHDPLHPATRGPVPTALGPHQHRAHF
jgi:hypothetical protein